VTNPLRTMSFSRENTGYEYGFLTELTGIFQNEQQVD